MVNGWAGGWRTVYPVYSAVATVHAHYVSVPGSSLLVARIGEI